MSSARPFTPAREDRGALTARTVGREQLLRRIDASIRSAATSRNRPHLLLIGPRGSGKSHLVEVALHEIDRDPTLRPRLAVVSIPEDVVGFTRLSDLIDEVVRSLGGERPARSASIPDRTAVVHDLLCDRVLLLTIENLDRVMGAIGPGGQRDFRAWVETSGEVLLLATTPALFAGVRDRDLPWYGAFAHLAVTDLDAEDGRELVRRLAVERGDTLLVDFVDSDTGRARIEALAALTGGSARIWTILADCLNPENLDALIPAVQDLLEGLVPYYQQLLWELPGNEQRIVRALAEGEWAALTVTEIADATDIDPTVVSVSLKRLHASRWVLSAKVDRGDRRRTWWQLREPLIRHHFQYRAGNGRLLTLIVTFLEIIFDSAERERLLLGSSLGSASFLHLLASLPAAPHLLPAGPFEANVDQLQSMARRWTTESGPDNWAKVGRTIDDCVERARAATFETATDEARVSAVGAALAAARPSMVGSDQARFTLIEAQWNLERDIDASIDHLSEAKAGIDPDHDWQLSYLLSVQLCAALIRGRRLPEARILADELVTLSEKIFGTHSFERLSFTVMLGELAAVTGETALAVGLLLHVHEESDRLPAAVDARQMREQAVDALGVALATMLLFDPSTSGQTPRVPDLTRDLLAASDGSAEAELRLPVELSAILDLVREIRAGAVTRPRGR